MILGHREPGNPSERFSELPVVRHQHSSRIEGPGSSVFRSSPGVVKGTHDECRWRGRQTPFRVVGVADRLWGAALPGRVLATVKS
jgi:hypothetical protein